MIGGHALNMRGISRNTHDLDLMVRRADLGFWMKRLGSMGYAAFNQTSAFVQFKAPDITAWPIDLMLVDDSTFEKACASATLEQYGEVQVLTASTLHLVAMKLHALKNEPAHRFKKDEGDLLGLLDLLHISTGSEEFKQLCEKYGSLRIYERLKKS